MGTVPYILLLGTAIIFGLAGLGAMLMLRRAPHGKPRHRNPNDPRRAAARSHRAAKVHAPATVKAAPATAPQRAAVPAPAVAPPAAPRLRPADICPTLDDDYDSPTQIFLRDDLPTSGFADTVTLEPGSTPPRPVLG